MTPTPLDRLPPHNIDAERALLGAVLRDNSIIPEAVDLASANDFHTVAHGMIFRAVLDLHNLGKPADIVTIAERLTQAKVMDEVGGAGYLAALWDAAPSAGNFRQYADIICKQAMRRRLIHAAREIEERAYDPGYLPVDAIADAERRIVELAGPTTTGYRFGAIDSAAFAAADFRPTWLIRRLLVKDQPCILGGPKKALKTSILVDLALSLGSGMPFLGQFTVYKKLRTVVISGESGKHTIQETARRVADAKGIDLAMVDVHWDFVLPQLASASELAELGRGLRDYDAEVVVIDPLYLALLAGQGQQGLSAANLYDMGPLLLRVATTCLNAGATPILAHHAKKVRMNPHEPLDLDDLAFSGVAEFARQWLLLSRREAFEPGSGIHHLWFSAGGSIGHGGLWALAIDEGQIDDDFHGRRWGVTIMTPGDSKDAAKESRDDKKAQQQRQKDKADDTAVVLALDKLDPQRDGVSYTRTREAAALNGARMTRAVLRLSDEGIIEELKVTSVAGHGAKIPARGIRRRRTPEHPNSGTEQRDSCPDVG